MVRLERGRKSSWMKVAQYLACWVRDALMLKAAAGRVAKHERRQILTQGSGGGVIQRTAHVVLAEDILSRLNCQSSTELSRDSRISTPVFSEWLP